MTAACVPASITTPGTFNIGITSVKFGDINNYSSNYKQASNNFYENFTGAYCLGKSKTTIPSGTATTLTVGPGLNNPHTIRAYIDYNNDGQFNETTELVLSQSGISNGSFATASVTPPAGAVLNTPLRMRVIGDFNGIAVTACYTPTYGQVEDYSVMIGQNNSLSVKDTETKNAAEISRDENDVYVKSNLKIHSLHIYDASGRLLTSQNSIKATEYRFPVSQKNIIVTATVVLEDGRVISKKLKF